MDDIEKKALALVNEVRAEYGKCLATGEARFDGSDWDNAFRRAIEKLEAEKAARAADREQHEAFRNEVSDAVEADIKNYEGLTFPRLRRFIIAKPDPLVEAVKDCQFASLDAIEDYVAKKLREAIEKRGGKIVWEEG